MLVLFSQGLSRRAVAQGPVLVVDGRGIVDRRLMTRRIGWHEIERICFVDVDRARVTELVLRRPEQTLAGTKWPVRIGADCQRAFGIPAVTISMLMLDGSVGDLVRAIRMHRPDLLHRENRVPGIEHLSL
jgi:hypothetical protein